MKWYEQHPPAPFEEADYNDFVVYKTLNAEPSSYGILVMYDANEAVYDHRQEELRIAEISEKLLKSTARKAMAPAGKQKLKNGSLGNRRSTGS